MKKKILFVLINMNIGGTEKALLNMISEMPREKYEITLFMLEKYGGLLSSIPENVSVEFYDGYKNIKPILNNPPLETAINFIKKGKIIKAFIIVLLHILFKVTNDRRWFFHYVLKDYPILKKEYDIAVAYDGPMDFISYFVLKKIKASKKFQWIHFDISKIGFNTKFADKLYRQFNKIFVVSQEARNELIKSVPSIKDKSAVFYNIVSSRNIHIQAKHGVGFTDGFKGLRILTVGRLSIEKGQELGIEVLAKLITEGYDVKWYCLGEGSHRQRLEELILDFKLEDKFILLGSDPNPYPYIAQCDLYVQTSRHEGYCLTLAEAKCLQKPIITTNFITAKEQIEDGVTGLITNMNVKELYESVKTLIINKEFRMRLSNKLKNGNEELDIKRLNF